MHAKSFVNTTGDRNNGKLIADLGKYGIIASTYQSFKQLNRFVCLQRSMRNCSDCGIFEHSSRLSDRSVHIVYVWGVGLLWIAISNIHGFICSVKTMISVSKLFWILFSGSAIFIIHIVHAIFVSTGIELRDLSAHARSALLQNVFF